MLLRCTHCTNERMQATESAIAPDSCGEGEWIGNTNGRLACENVPPPAALDDEDETPREDEGQDEL